MRALRRGRNTRNPTAGPAAAIQGRYVGKFFQTAMAIALSASATMQEIPTRSDGGSWTVVGRGGPDGRGPVSSRGATRDGAEAGMAERDKEASGAGERPTLLKRRTLSRLWPKKWPKNQLLPRRYPIG